VLVQGVHGGGERHSRHHTARPTDVAVRQQPHAPSTASTATAANGDVVSHIPRGPRCYPVTAVVREQTHKGAVSDNSGAMH
jgi:hypothetical protein